MRRQRCPDPSSPRLLLWVARFGDLDAQDHGLFSHQGWAKASRQNRAMRETTLDVCGRDIGRGDGMVRITQETQVALLKSSSFFRIPLFTRSSPT